MKNKKLFFILFYSCLFIPTFLLAQHETKNWYFGNGTDGIVFDNNNNPVKVTNKYPGIGYEGNVTASDPYSGQLLFYSDGITVINSLHQVMLNGNGLFGDMSCSQGAEVCRVPNTCNKYYIVSNGSEDNLPGNLYYSIVDFTSNPLGQVTNKNTYINGPSYHQAMKIIPKANSNNYWLIGHLMNTATYHVFEVTSAGFIGPVVYNFTHGGRSWAMEYCDVTHKLVNFGMDNIGTDLFDFDPATGVMSNEIQLSTQFSGGGAFSPDGTKLYASLGNVGVFWQYDFNTSTWTNMNTCCWAHEGELGPDGILYFIHTYNGANPLGDATNPNLSAVGNACNYNPITIGNFNGEVRRFPEFLVSTPPPVAILDTLTIISGDSILINPLANDYDPTGNPIALDSVIYGPHLGTDTIIGNQIFYKANPGICSGYDTMIYKISNSNCSYASALIIIHIIGGNAISSFTPIITNCSLSVDFTNNSTGSTFYYWNFGDGHTDTVLNPNHTYLTPGTYTVTLVVGSGVCSDTTTQSITVGQMPVAAFTPITNNCSLTVGFTNTSTGSAIFHWNFGDNQTSNLNSPSHTYASSGTYTITLIAGTGNCADTITQIITVNPTSIASFTPTILNCDPSVSFTNNSSGFISYNWNFGDGNTSNLTNPIHTYNTSGSYWVTFIAVSGTCNDTIQQLITINPIPIASFAYGFTGCNSIVSFTNNSSGGNTYHWNFGDGDTSNNQTPVHTYSTMGNYSVSLIVTNSSGCSDTITQPVNTAILVVPDFNWMQAPCDPNVVFNNISTNGFSSYWQLGDGETSNATGVDHTYNIIGNFTVTLVINDGTPCKATITKTINVTTSNTDELYIPNAFTPNGDGINDVFVVQSINDCVPYEMSIYNRWGQMLFYTDSYPLIWDGTFNGEPVPTGSYIYLIRGGNFNKTGIVTVIK